MRTVSGHGNIVVSGSNDNTLIVWDIVQMKCLCILNEHTDRVYSTIYDHEMKRCISSSMDNTIIVWNLEDISSNEKFSNETFSASSYTKILGAMYILRGHTAIVGLLRLSEEFLVSAAAGGVVNVWDANSYLLKHSFDNTNSCGITALEITDDILLSGSQNLLNMYNLRSGLCFHSGTLNGADQIWSVNLKGKLPLQQLNEMSVAFWKFWNLLENLC